MTWHDALPLEVSVEMQTLAGGSWDVLENAVWQYQLDAKERARVARRDYYSRAPERRERARRRREWRQNARSRVVAVRCCPICRRMFVVDALARAEGKDNACRGRCRQLLNFEGRLVAIGRERDTVTNWSRRHGLSETTAKYRMVKMRWAPLQAVTAPPIPPAERRWRGVDTLAAKARAAGLSPSLVRHRLAQGWTLEKALACTPNETRRNRTDTHVAAAKGSDKGLAATYARMRKYGIAFEQALALPKWARLAPRKDSLKARAEAAGLPYAAVYARVRLRGWTIERALSTPTQRKETA